MSIKTIRNLILALGMVLAASCTKDKLDGEGFRLYYPDGVEFAQNIGFNITPSWKGGTPEDFKITQVKLDDSYYVGPEFSINPTTGVLTVSGTVNTAPGIYSISISCTVAGVKYSFPDKLTVTFLNGIPDGISTDPGFFFLNIADLKADSSAELPTAQVITEGEHIKIESYSIRNVKKDGEYLDNVTNPYFSISSDGVISAVKGAPFEVGTYVLDLKLTTRSYSEESQVGLFTDAVTVHVVSAPTSLSYNRDEFLLDEGDSYFESAAPVVVGSLDGLEFSIQANPATDKISIDAQTGIIKVASGHGFVKDDVYMVDVYVKNAYIEEPVCFQRVLTIKVVESIPAIQDFIYAQQTKKMVLGWTAEPEPADNGTYIYEFTDPAADYVKWVSLDSETGKLSAVKGNKLPVGTHEISVTARDAKYQNPKEVVFKLDVVENPYYFTYFSYGNNLGLTEAQTGGVSQFRVFTEEELLSLNPAIRYTDLPDGVNVKFSGTRKAQLSGTSVNQSTGQISFQGFASQKMGVYIVTATTKDPSDAENTFSVKVPVFVDFSGETGAGISVQYSPFVLRFNPKQGGRSAVPEIKGADLADFYMDWRRTFSFYNLDGDDNIFKPEGTVANCPFLQHLWNNCGSTNYSSKDAVGFYDGANPKSSAVLAKQPTYVDGTRGSNYLSVVANRGVWFNQEWADGVFIGEMTVAVNPFTGFTNLGTALSNAAEDYRFNPIALWIDRDYLE
ncbi:MAG: surface glycan-binding family protein [Candidatus Cryptobacteroides sp.]